MKRVYRAVELVAGDGGFGVTLDGRPLRTRRRQVVTLASEALATAVRAEWDAQTETVDPRSMPMTRFVNSAIDLVARERARIIELVAGYGGSDLVCYRAETPPDLAARQAEAWDPLLAWLSAAHEVVLHPTSGIRHRAQPPDCLARLRAIVDARDDMALTALHEATAITGSLVIALAFVGARLDAESAWRAATIDESYQIETWGEDADARARHERLRADLCEAADFLRCLRD